MPTPFPGMDPYLEHPDLWPDVHHGLIEAVRSDLAPALRPRYRVLVDKRTYLVETDDLTFMGRPDVAAIRSVEEVARSYTVDTRVETVRVPVPDIVEEGYLEVRDTQDGDVVTVIELLSPSNKRSGAGRRRYERERLTIFESQTHLVEIDLLHAHESMLVYGAGEKSHYRILVSRSERRPEADLYAFNVQNEIPTFPLPLRPDDDEPVVELSRLLHELYDRAGYDLSIDYTHPPVPPFEGVHADWVADFATR